ncbi:uncharacterized protein [Blastocystis hominis]|uniref:Deacetylase sirtuin-type domain-containing protein n=1 Tax=Blastocystis hominis TaxID=12968 RepID=D8LVF9_BLAHO|nr:uncharacterized protein [Blastocystis hominis]CBK19798.2 unnamed protein product [Blastocystis hominis]|eukprot:XP_012893846.1 uncharacterized protein [Blastocystis hominis]
MFYSDQKYHPTPCHFMLSLLKDRGILRRIYTQNIDGLERDAGLEPPLLVEGHGTSRECACFHCGQEFRSDLPQRSVDSRTVPFCPSCGGPIKPKIVFFHEHLPSVLYSCFREDMPVADLLIVIGSSLRVYPIG